MKPNFALSLSFDGIRLLHRVTGGWHLVSEVALDAPDLAGELAVMRRTAMALDPRGLRTKLLIPNEQIKYLAIDTTRASEDDILATLDGATPYAVADLAYDYSRGGGRTYVAAVARETLDEAEAFATQHAFSPVCFAAVPEPFTYVGEAFFGQTSVAPALIGPGKMAERDDEPVTVTGRSTIAPVLRTQPPVPLPTVPLPPQTPVAQPPEKPETVAQPEPDPVPKILPETVPEIVAQTGPESAPGSAPEPVPAPMPEVAPAQDLQDTPPEPEPTPDAAPLPTFSSRHRGGPSGAPAAPPVVAPMTMPPTPLPGETRAGIVTAPPIAQATPPSLAVPMGPQTARVSLAGVGRPDRDARSAPIPTALGGGIVATPPPVATVTPPITGQSGAVRPDASAPIIDLTATRPTPPAPRAYGTPEAAASLGATLTAPSVAGVVAAETPAPGGMFSSRRRAARLADADTTSKDEVTVFGARKAAAVGGKPRYLGLVLTAILLLFLAAVAAWAAISDDGFARLFGRGGDTVQTAGAEMSVPIVLPDQGATTTGVSLSSTGSLLPPAPTISGEELADLADAAIDEGSAPLVAAVAETDTQTLPPTGTQTEEFAPSGVPLTPAEAERIYAATGVWQRAPRLPLVPQTEMLDDVAFAAFEQRGPTPDLTGLPAPDLSTPDGAYPTPNLPPPAGTVFARDAAGFILATPEGVVLPSGVTVYAGRPDVVPPPRPTPEAAPDATPDAVAEAPVAEDPVADAPLPDAPQITAGGVALATLRPASRPDGLVIPQTAAPESPVNTALAGFRPRLRPAGLAPAPEPEPAAEPEVTPATDPDQQGRIAPEDVTAIAAAIAASAPPDPTAGATARAVAQSRRPDTRPRNFDRVVAAARRAPPAAAAAPAQQASAPVPQVVSPTGPVPGGVARAATDENLINLRQISLIGISGAQNARRALVRMGNGRVVTLRVGDSFDGGQVSAIGETVLNYVKRGRTVSLELPPAN